MQKRLLHPLDYKYWKPVTWKPSDSSIPLTRGDGTGEFEREPALELDLDEVCELVWETWAWATREAEVGRELGREFGEESALVTLDNGAKIPDDGQLNSKIIKLNMGVN